MFDQEVFGLSRRGELRESNEMNCLHELVHHSQDAVVSSRWGEPDNLSRCVSRGVLGWGMD